MYPLIRVALAMRAARKMPAQAPGEVHSITTRCWPWDIDPFMELNNGRSMTLMDIGRLPLAQRGGLIAMMKREGWRMTMAGAVVQYRRRVAPFAPMEIRTRAIGRAARFLYIEHLTLARGVPAHNAMYRAAVVDADGIVDTDRVAASLGHGDWNPELPPWVRAWSDAEALRPWPPTF
jgi:acyl-CoA thioesterase FadM